MTYTVIALLITPVLLIGGVFLQIFLSKSKSKWLGLILPLLCLLFSLIAVLSVPAYTHGQLTLQEIAPDGTMIEHTIEQGMKPVTNNGSPILQIIVVFLIYNIPTTILMLIYYSCRQRIKKKCEIDKMNILDLE